MGSLSALGPALSLCHSAWARTYESMRASYPLVTPADQASSLGSPSLPGLCLPPLWVRRDSGSSVAMSQVIVGLGRQPAFRPEPPCLLSGTSSQRQMPGAGD